MTAASHRTYPPESYCHRRSAVAETNYGGSGGQARLCLGCWLDDIADGPSLPPRRFKDWFGVRVGRTELLERNWHQATCECGCEHQAAALLGEMDVSQARLVCDACLAEQHLPAPRVEGIAAGLDTPRGRVKQFARKVRALTPVASSGDSLAFTARFDLERLHGVLADEELAAHLEAEWEALPLLAERAGRLDDTDGITDGLWPGTEDARHPFYAALYAIALRDLLAPERFAVIVAPWRQQLPDLGVLC